MPPDESGVASDPLTLQHLATSHHDGSYLLPLGTRYRRHQYPAISLASWLGRCERFQQLSPRAALVLLKVPQQLLSPDEARHRFLHLSWNCRSDQSSNPLVPSLCVTDLDSLVRICCDSDCFEDSFFGIHLQNLGDLALNTIPTTSSKRSGFSSERQQNGSRFCKIGAET
ncbi:hypothetical protein VTK56DRAFT_9145 [Thermocarpiscus australiensis]